MLEVEDFGAKDDIEVYKPKKKEEKKNRFVLLLHALGWCPTIEWVKALRFHKYDKERWAIWNLATQWGVFVAVVAGKLFHLIVAKIPLAIAEGFKAIMVKVTTFVTATVNVLQDMWT